MPNNEEEKVSRYESDKAMLHMNSANRRMLIALVVICLTCIIIVFNNTIRETHWQKTVTEMQNQMIQTITELKNGTQ